MSHLSQVWQLLRICVRGHWLKEILKKTSLRSQAVSPLGNQNKHGKSDFSPSNWREFIFQERVQKSLAKWTISKSRSTLNKGERQLHEEIYELLGGGTLRPEILSQVMSRLIADQEFYPVRLFQALQDFYQRWCQGEFIDASPANNLPLKKMLKMQAQQLPIGLRQVDINTGLNVMILLLELHRYAQQRDDLKHQIIFYPSGQRDKDHFFTSQLLRIINYSDAIEIGNFSNVVGEFLKGGNFRGAYLGDANLTSVNFSHANLSSAYLGDANLTGTNFCGANLSTANLGDANLCGANLSDANLKRTDLSSTNLSGANLSGANLSGANLSHANLSSADLSSADLSSADLKGANLTGANLKDAQLSSANLTDAIFFGANLSDANLKGVDFSHADFCRADLSGADLSQAILKGTNLSDTILFSTDLTNAILVAADLSYAKLNGAKLNGANLKGAILLSADLSGVDLSGVLLNEADLSGVLMSEADLRGADLREAILFGSDLSYANLSSANLSGSNLSGAILSGADLSDTDLSYAILGGVDLSDANLEDITWNENPEWQSVRGLDTAFNVPEALKQKLGLG